MDYVNFSNYVMTKIIDIEKKMTEKIIYNKEICLYN